MALGVVHTTKKVMQLPSSLAHDLAIVFLAITCKKNITEDELLIAYKDSVNKFEELVKNQ